MKIFRYYKFDYGLSVLKDLEIRTSVPTELNDPFEIAPNIDPAQFNQKRLEAVLRQDAYVEEAYRKENQRFGLTKKEFRRLYFKDVPRRAAKALPEIPRNVERMRRDFANKFSKYWRLLCASRVHDSVLMWSHYADKHKGLVLGFDTNYPPFSQMPTDCWLTVTYSERKPDYLYSPDENEFREKMFATAAVKERAWSYEKEVRLVIADKALREKRFLPITPQSVIAVYCGCRISAPDKQAVQTALRAPHLQHVEVLSATLDESRYALRFQKSIV